MTDKITLANISNLQQQTSTINAINANNATLIAAIDNTLSRDGTTPNSMSAQIDMNSNRIINLAAPVNSNDAARLVDVQAVSGNAAALAIAVGQAQSAQAAAAASATSASTALTSATTQATTAATQATSAAAQATAAATSATSSAASAASAAALLVLTNTRLAKSANYTLLNADKGKTVALSGTNITLTVSAASGYDANFLVMVVNESTTRGQTLAINGYSNFILYPGQTITLFNSNNTWHYDPVWQRWNAAVTFYVDPVGSDANDGLATGAGGAFLTIQKAVNVVQGNLDRGPLAQPIIQLADGTYDVGAGVNMNYQGGSTNNLVIQGNASTPDNVIVQCAGGGNCFNARDGAVTVTLKNMKLSTRGNSSTLLSVSQMAVVDVSAVNFDAAPLGIHIDVSTFASVNVLANYSVEGNATIHVRASNGAYVGYGSFTVTGSSNLTFTDFVVAQLCGIINAGGSPMSFSGFASVTGQKYAAATNGVIASSSTTYPGPTAGTTSTGGLYS